MSHLTRGAWIEIRFERIHPFPDGKSHLTRGAWIEIHCLWKFHGGLGGRTSHEVRGLKWKMQLTITKRCSRTSHEVRGLKCTHWDSPRKNKSRTSHEVRGLKLKINNNSSVNRTSHLTRGAWIEIIMTLEELQEKIVAPHTRCVD